MHLRDNRFITASVILMFAAFTLAGCAERRFSHAGDRAVQKDLRIQLEDGSRQGVWKTDVLAITYQYRMAPESLNIAGTVELVGGFAIGFRYISHLAVYLLFLDNEGMVIENSLVYAGENNLSVPIPMGFERTVPIPGGVRTISFYYDVSFAHEK